MFDKVRGWVNIPLSFDIDSNTIKKSDVNSDKRLVTFDSDKRLAISD